MLLGTQGVPTTGPLGAHFGASEPKSAVPPSSWCVGCVQTWNCWNLRKLGAVQSMGTFLGGPLGSPGAQFWPSTPPLSHARTLFLIVARIVSCCFVSYCLIWFRSCQRAACDHAGWPLLSDCFTLSRLVPHCSLISSCLVSKSYLRLVCAAGFRLLAYCCSLSLIVFHVVSYSLILSHMVSFRSDGFVSSRRISYAC